MEDYISKQLIKSHLDRKNGKNKEIDINDFIKNRENRLLELFPKAVEEGKINFDILKEFL